MYVIDGHNLIPKLGWSLSEIDDEQRLIDALQQFVRARRKKVDVFFDRAPIGHSGERRFGNITAHFVQEGKIADDAIIQYITRLGKGARNVTVVSSDNHVQINAHALHAQVMTSEDFADQLKEILTQRGGRTGSTAQPENLAAGELGEFLDLFGLDPREAEKPIEPTQPQPKKKPTKPATGRKYHGFPKRG